MYELFEWLYVPDLFSRIGSGFIDDREMNEYFLTVGK